MRLSKKNFCHIRFVLESSVDAAIYLSGYRVRIGSSGDPANTGRLHVDFAQVHNFIILVYKKLFMKYLFIKFYFILKKYRLEMTNMNGNVDNVNYRENNAIEKELKRKDKGHHPVLLQ